MVFGLLKQEYFEWKRMACYQKQTSQNMVGYE